MIPDRSVLDNTDRLIECGLIDVSRACPYLTQEQLYPEEALDAFVQLSVEQRIFVFPFFDEIFYKSQLEAPLRDEVNPLIHFLCWGIGLLLSPHALIQPAAMLRARPDLFSGRLDLTDFVTALCSDLCDPSPFLWLTWYRGHARLKADEPAFLNYIRSGAGQNLAPNPYFSPKAYAASAPEAPQNGVALVCHFLTQGDNALTSVGDRFDASWYVAEYPDAKSYKSGPLSHFLGVGRHLGYLPRKAGEAIAGQRRLSPVTTDALFTEDSHAILGRYSDFSAEVARAHRARVVGFREHDLCPVKITDHVTALKELTFPCWSEPDIDVLIPCYNEFEITVECLVALSRTSGRRRLRITVVDDASPDERYLSMNSVPGLVVQRNSQNLHFLLSCNQAFDLTSAPLLLLLNNDTQVLDGAIDRLADALDRDTGIAAAVPMFLYPNGRLQEAGCTLRHNGESTMIGVGEDPTRPCYNYLREVQYGSGACLLLRRSALQNRLFDARFAPAYCEDADLCLRLRNDGGRIVYEPAAQIVHHLSVSTSVKSQRRRVQIVRRNQQKLADKWSELLRKDNSARVLAFYLPQFHPIDRNDVWWGKGFTEWTNVTRATASFEGHYQPHLPADFGFYDLRRVETMGEQQATARRYGIEGFIVYYYNFGSARVLDQPMEQLLKRPDVDFRFALCWANENWTRHWDGGVRAMLLEQLYDEETLNSVAADMVRFAGDRRLILVDGKPLVMVYRPLLFPEPRAFTEILRSRFAAAGFRGVHLVYVESMEAIQKQLHPKDLGFDACVEFPPQGIGEHLSRSVSVIKAGWEGSLYDYAGTASNAIIRPTTSYPRYPAVVPSWDNTARQPLKGTTLVGAEPELFQVYVEQKLEEMLNNHIGDSRLLFVNAWNEWAEGAHLEPDRAYGHRWLMALRNALLSKGLIG